MADMFIAWTLLAVATLLFVVFGAVFAYHWIRWALSPVAPTLAIAIYVIFGGILLAMMLASTIAMTIA